MLKQLIATPGHYLLHHQVQYITEASYTGGRLKDRFRFSKHDDLVSIRIELTMAVAGRKRSIAQVIDDMRHLYYVLRGKKGAGHLGAA